MKRTFGIIGKIVWLAGLALLVARAEAAIGVGAAFPSLAEAQLEGALPATQDKVVVVDFWASWCAPCKASFPSLARLEREFAPRGVVFLGVSEDDKAKDYAAFLKKFAPPFATVRDATHKLATAVQVPAMPTTYVVGRDGKVVAVLTGYHGESSDAALRAALEQALKN